MSRENVELLRGMYDRFNRGDLAAGLDNIDADFVLRDRTLPEFPDELRGIAYQGYLDRLGESFGDLRYEVESVSDLGDRLVVQGSCERDGSRNGGGRQRHHGSCLDGQGRAGDSARSLRQLG